jgi:hypothetical protein
MPIVSIRQAAENRAIGTEASLVPYGRSVEKRMQRNF